VEHEEKVYAIERNAQEIKKKKTSRRKVLSGFGKCREQNAIGTSEIATGKMRAFVRANREWHGCIQIHDTANVHSMARAKTKGLFHGDGDRTGMFSFRCKCRRAAVRG